LTPWKDAGGRIPPCVRGAMYAGRARMVPPSVPPSESRQA
jgi:hypothetical protein